MQTETFQAKRTADGAIDISHYARAAAAERRQTRTNAMHHIGRGSRRVLLAIAAIISFWNVPPMGPGGPKDAPYR